MPLGWPTCARPRATTTITCVWGTTAVARSWCQTTPTQVPYGLIMMAAVMMAVVGALALTGDFLLAGIGATVDKYRNTSMILGL